jgi:hypothetical protein
MRSVLASGLLIGLFASADAAPQHHPRARQHIVIRPNQVIRPDPGGATPRFAVPGWSDESTRRWMDNVAAGPAPGG